MSYRNYIIQDNVSIEDIQQALEEGSKDLYTLCRSNNINKWAKFKPVRRTKGPNLGQEPLIDTVSQWDKNAKRWSSSSTWWQADNGLCGLIIPNSFTSILDLVQAYLGSTASTSKWEWGYAGLPNTEAVSNRVYASRQMDFYGYGANARPPMHDFRSEREVYFSKGTLKDSSVTISAGYNLQSFLNGASLSLKDFATWTSENCYFGVVLVKEPELKSQLGDTYHGCITTSYPINHNSFSPSVTIPISNSGITPGSEGKSQKYYAIGFISNQQKSTYTLEPNMTPMGTIYSIGLPFSTFSIVGESDWLGLRIESASPYNQDEVEVRVRLFTWRTRGTGNATDRTLPGSSGNISEPGEDNVWVYSVRVEGKFASSSPSGAPIIDDGRMGEPVVTLETTTSMPIRIPCREITEDYKSTELVFRLDNRTDGTGRMTHPLRYVIATATLYHGGDGSTVGTWNNTNATKEVDSHRYTLSSGN